MVLVDNSMLLADKFTDIQQAALPGNQVPPTVGALITTILPWIFSIAGLLLLVFFVMAGFQYMTSRGDPKAMQAAQAKITTALIGFFIIFLSFAIIKLIANILGLTVFGTIFT